MIAVIPWEIVWMGVPSVCFCVVALLSTRFKLKSEYEKEQEAREKKYEANRSHDKETHKSYATENELWKTNCQDMIRILQADIRINGKMEDTLHEIKAMMGNYHDEVMKLSTRIAVIESRETRASH